jgi:hypothetical protein
MNVNAQDYLELCEANNDICFWDIEATGLKGDYNSILVVSICPFYGDPITFSVDRVGDDAAVCREAKEVLEQFKIWTGYYSRGYDIGMLNTRLFKNGDKFVEKRHHLDLYFQLKTKLSASRRSQAHYMNWFNDGSDEEKEMDKMSMGANMWADMPAKIDKLMPKMIDRCESDVKGLRLLYNRVKPLINDITM